MNRKLSAFLTVCAGIALLAFSASAAYVAASVSEHLQSVSQSVASLSEQRESAKLAGFEQELRLLRAEVSDLKGQLVRVASDFQRTELDMRDFSDKLEKITQLMQNLPQGPPNAGMRPRPERPDDENRIFVALMGQLKRVLPHLHGLAAKKKAEDGKYWPDGFAAFGPPLDMPGDKDIFVYRYFASPDARQFTLVIMPNSAHERIRNAPSFALAYCSNGDVFLCKDCPVENVADLIIDEFDEPSNVPALGKWELVWDAAEMEKDNLREKRGRKQQKPPL
ncbi:MAG: hypothetical protein U5N86_12405 [Planctomycetota bacterium]|nr:hypothetical protein [Planctomycetota bacterium]